MESLSCGTPVIIPDRGSPPTFLNNQVAVYLQHTPTLFDLYKTLYKLSKSPTSNLLRLTCRDFALKHFSSKNAKIIEKSYHV